MSDRLAPLARWCIICLSAIGLGISTYLTIGHLNDTAPACGSSGGCEAVTTSDYAVFLGVPVAMIGVFGYSLLLLGNLASVGLRESSETLAKGLVLVAVLGELFSIYLISAQVFLIGGFCFYCIGSATSMTLILALSISILLSSHQSTGSVSVRD